MSNLVRSAVTLDLWLTLAEESAGQVASGQRRSLRVDNTLEVLAGYERFPTRASLEAAFLQMMRTIDADHLLGIDTHFSERVAGTLDLVEHGLSKAIGDSGVARVAEAVDRAYIDSPPHLIAGTRETLASLETLGVGMALISNTGFTSGAAYRRWLEDLGLIEYFRYLAFSNDMAVAKPSSRIFMPALENLGIEPRRGMHVGDNLLSDVGGAAAIGMATTWIENDRVSGSPVRPDFTIGSIAELPTVVERWLRSL